MKNIIVNISILALLYACSGGGGGGAGSDPKEDSQIKNKYSKTKDLEQREFLNALNSILKIKGGGSFIANSNLSFKEGLNTCVGTTELKILFDKESKRYSVERKVSQTGGNCKGKSLARQYQTGVDLNLGFIYKLALSNRVKFSEGMFEGVKSYLIIAEEKEEITTYLLSVKGESLESLQTEYIYNGGDGYIKVNTKILPTGDTKINANLLEDTPETGDILELSEYPLYDLIG